MGTWSNSKARLIDFSKEPLGWPEEDDEHLIDINTLRNMGKVALDIIQKPPTGAALLSSVPEDLNLIRQDSQECFESDMQRDNSSSILPSSNESIFSDLEASLTAELEQISARSHNNPRPPNTSNFGSSLTIPDISLQTPEGDYIPPQIFLPDDTLRDAPTSLQSTHYASPPHFPETAYLSDDHISPNPSQTDNTSNPIIYNGIGYNTSFNTSHSVIPHYPMDGGQGDMQNTIATDPVPLTNKELQMEPSQTQTYPDAPIFESSHTAFPVPTPREPYRPLPQEFASGESARYNEVFMPRPQTASDSFPHVPSQMTAENSYPTSFFLTNSTFSSPGTTRSVSYNEQRISSSPECTNLINNPPSQTNQSVYSQPHIPMDMIHLDNVGSSRVFTQPRPDIPQSTLGKEEFVYQHRLLEPILVRNTLNRDDSSVGSDLTSDRSVHRSFQDTSVEQRQGKGKQRAVESPIRERKSSANRRLASGPYFRPIRAKSPGSATSTPSPIGLTIYSPSPSPAPTSDEGTCLTWPAGISEASRASGWPVNIPFNTRTEEANTIQGVAFTNLKRLNFGISAVSEILDDAEERPLSRLPIMTELFVLVEWPLGLEQDNGQRHKVAKLDRSINHFRRVDILCKVAKRLYDYAQAQKAMPLDPKKLRIMSLRQQIDNKEWTVEVIINSASLQ